MLFITNIIFYILQAIIRMLKIIVLTFLSLLIHQTYPSETPTTISIDIKRCTFYIEPPLENITFLHCEMATNSNETQWKTCVDTCCNNMAIQANSKPNYDTLKICKDMSTQEADLDSITIIMFIGVSIGCLLVLYCFFQMIYKVIKSSFRNQVTQNDLTNQGIRSQRQNIKQLFSKITWLNPDNNSMIQTNMACTICLEQKCLIQLPCMHIYHSQCIVSWFKKSKFCPLCHFDKISSIKHYCQECHKYYFIFQIKSFEKNYLSLNKMRCSKCTEDSNKIIRSSSMRQLQQRQTIETSTQNIVF